MHNNVSKSWANDSVTMVTMLYRHQCTLLVKQLGVIANQHSLISRGFCSDQNPNSENGVDTTRSSEHRSSADSGGDKNILDKATQQFSTKLEGFRQPRRSLSPASRLLAELPEEFIKDCANSVNAVDSEVNHGGGDVDKACVFEVTNPTMAEESKHVTSGTRIPSHRVVIQEHARNSISPVVEMEKRIVVVNVVDKADDKSKTSDLKDPGMSEVHEDHFISNTENRLDATIVNGRSRKSHRRRTSLQPAARLSHLLPKEYWQSAGDKDAKQIIDDLSNTDKGSDKSK